MANRVTMSICGTEYILVAEEDAAYMEKIGNMVDAEMQKLMDSAHMSRDAAAGLAAVNPGPRGCRHHLHRRLPRRHGCCADPHPR